MHRSKRTRYFVFTRVNPSSSDYDRLLGECQRIDASLGYKTIRDGWKVRLVGFIVLCGRTTIPDDIGRLFPNFNVTSLGPGFQDGFDWMAGVAESESGFFVDGATFNNAIEHPYVQLKTLLFAGESKLGL